MSPDSVQSNSNPESLSKKPRPSQYKKYQPTFTNIGPQLPSIESFQLDNVLNNVLQNESQQVIDNLLNVTTNYQNDLRGAIKHNLSVEQKIQFKNIEVAKLANSLNKTIKHRLRRLRKALSTSKNADVESNMIDSEVNRLLKCTITAGSKINNLVERLSTIDKKIHADGDCVSSRNTTKMSIYPNVYKLLQSRSSEGTPPNELEQQEIDGVEEDYFNSISMNGVAKRTVLDSEQDIPMNTSKGTNTLDHMEENLDDAPDPNLIANHLNVAMNTSNNGAVKHTSRMELEEVGEEHGETKESEVCHRKEQSDVEMDPDAFEEFMSDSISRYRKLQSQKYQLQESFEVRPGRPNKNTPRSNPLNLLYSQLLSNPKYIESVTLRDSSWPFSNMLTMKSDPTIKLTLQTSHFKKLRINGAPITSETFKNGHPVECTCSEQHRHHDARKRIAESLLENLRLSSDEDSVWNSSGINTEEEEEDHDQHGSVIEDADNFGGILSSDSSEPDSSGDEHHHTSGGSTILNTNLYYSNLKSNLQQKKNNVLLKKRKQGSKGKSNRNYHVKEFSPTPKHKPSHHILKPKRSILKSQRSFQFSKENSPFRRAGMIADKFDEKVSDERCALSAVNNAFSTSINSEISDFNVQGTILPADDSLVDEYHADLSEAEDPIDDQSDTYSVHSTRSVSILKAYIL